MAVPAYHVIQKEIENRVFKHNRIFRHTCRHTYMHKHPIQTKKQSYNKFLQILYRYLSYIDRLVSFLLLVVILSEFQENPRRRDELQKRVHRSTCVEENTFLAARPSFYVIFCRFFRLLPVFRQLRFYVKKIFCHRKYC